MHETGNDYSLIFVSGKINFILPLFSKYNVLKLLTAGCILYTKGEKGAINQIAVVRAHCVVLLHNRDKLNHFRLRSHGTYIS